MGDNSVIAVGGKGANQAAAAAACGANTRFLGRVGTDAFGLMVRAELRSRGVGIEEAKQLSDASTGLAAIYVEHSGQNCIVVVPGANGRLTPTDIEGSSDLIGEAAIVVVQCEIPIETVYRTIEVAAMHKTPVILNPAPAHQVDLTQVANKVAYLVPNETEASQLTGTAVESVAGAEKCAKLLLQQGIECVIITLGPRGCVVADKHSVVHIPPYHVEAIDATGAGDAFVGCLAASIAEGRSREESVRRAVVYSALSTTKRGALISYLTGEPARTLLLNHSN